MKRRAVMKGNDVVVAAVNDENRSAEFTYDRQIVERVADHERGNQVS